MLSYPMHEPPPPSRWQASVGGEGKFSPIKIGNGWGQRPGGDRYF